MTDDAYARFAKQVERTLRAGQSNLGEALKHHDKRMRDLEREKRNLLNILKLGVGLEAVVIELNRLDAEHKALSAGRDKLVPVPLELPGDLPQMYRAYVEDLTTTLMDDDVVGAVGDELHRLIDRIVVTWQPEAERHELVVEGDLVEMLKSTKPALGAGIEFHERSLKLVAGAGFEPATFRL